MATITPKGAGRVKTVTQTRERKLKAGDGEVGAEGDRLWEVEVVEEKGWLREVEELDVEGLDSKQGTRGERKGDEGKRTKGADKEVEGLDVEEVKLREEEQLDVEGLDNKHARGKEKGDEIESTKGAGQEVEGLDVEKEEVYHVAGKLDPRGSTGQRKSDQVKKKRGRKLLRLGTINCHTRVEINREQLLYTLSEVAGVDICALTETFLKEEDRSAIEFMTEESGYSWIGKERLGRKGGGKGFFVQKSIIWKEESTSQTRAFWIRVGGLGAVGVVYFPPSENKADFEARVDALVVECRARKGEGQVIVMGDFNARVGELSNRYQIGGRDIVEGRASKDKVINARGRYLHTVTTRWLRWM